MTGFCEQVVKKKRTAKDNVMAVIYFLLAIGIPATCILLAYVISAYFIYIGFFVLIAAIPSAIWMVSNQKIEYEYQVVDNFLVVDKVVAKRKRRKIIRVKIDEFKSIVKFNDENYNGKKINKYYICIDELDNPNALAFNYYSDAKGNCALVIIPDEKILTGMRPKLTSELQVQVIKMLREKNYE